MMLLIPVFVVFVAISFVIFMPFGRWKRLEKNFLLKESPGDAVAIKRFTDIILDGVQLNGLVSVWVYKDCLVLKHISPLMKPLVFCRTALYKTNRRRAGFDVFKVSENGVEFEIGLRKRILNIWNIPVS